jgi:Do/DeqQ family serine protease
MKKNISLVTIVLVSVLSGFIGSYIFKKIDHSADAFLRVAGNDLPIKMASNGLNVAGFEEASAISTPTVVFIKTLSNVQYESPFGGLFWDFDPFGSRGQATSTGSGVIVNSDGYIVTNNHVIQGGEKITVILNNSKKEYVAKVIGTDPSSDLALIKIEEKNLPAVVFANSDEVKVGEWVLAVGNPFNLTSTVTAGIESAKGRNINIVKNQFPIESFIQTDAAINPGNSGGALVDLKGRLVGINTAIQSNTGSYSGYGFAIPSNIVQKIVQDFIEKGEVLRAFAGMEVTELASSETESLSLKNEAVKIKEIQSEGPAAKAGLKVNDVIVKIGNTTINGRSSYDEFMAYQRPGKSANLVVLRAGKEMTISLNLIDKKENQALIMKGAVNSKYLGADFQPLSKTDCDKYKIASGIRILNVQRNQFVAQMGLPNGFILTKFNGKTYTEAEDLIAAMEAGNGRIEIEGKDQNGSPRSYSFFRY